MTSRLVGKHGLYVPRVGFGTAPLATAPAWGPGAPIPESQALDALTYAWAAGIRFYDTAPNYVLGLAEQRLGLLLAAVPRDELILTTKVGFDVSGGQSRRDYSRDGVLRSLEGSLKRLKVDRVDIVHVHDPDDTLRDVLDVTFPALNELREQGVIRAIGAGMNQWQVPLELARHADFDCFMLASRYTLLEQGALPFLDYCAAKGIAVFAGSIYNSGILATGGDAPQARYNHAPAPPDIRDQVRRIAQVCHSYDVPLHSAATQFPLLHPAVASIVVGFQTPAEVRACLDALQHEIPPALWDALQREGLLFSGVSTPSMKANHGP
ncbi:MAG: aldo/keto reductase [Pleurocapsa minor GSE-CHR-MK-17-07R]|jgi:D-threo-aldose 1-dehydrogenase|nr:aldo/keto reductase [Pleurocapsa minor GSE-CHR-MK 17-07R]